jgi:DNA invertase Pin-like site-specific DNA recombinase
MRLRMSAGGLPDFEDFQNGSLFIGAAPGGLASNFDRPGEEMEPDVRSGAPRRVGYARVSTEEQNLSLQFDALRAAGCAHIFYDEGISGVTVSRPALSEALSALRRGDVLVVWKLDRLGRSLGHLIEIVSDLNANGIGFQSLSEAIDTTTAGGRLIFHVMGALAEFERALISERTKAGMASAKARGAAIGRPPKLTAEQIRFAQQEVEQRRATIALLAQSFDVSPLTLERALKRMERAA